MILNAVKKEITGKHVSRLFLNEYSRFLYTFRFMKHVLSVLNAHIKIQKNQSTISQGVQKDMNFISEYGSVSQLL